MVLADRPPYVRPTSRGRVPNSKTGFVLGVTGCLLLVASCGGGMPEASALAYQNKLQRSDRYARAERPEPGRLVVTLHDNARSALDRKSLAPMARRIAERAYDEGDARSADTLIVEFHRGRQLGPLTLGATVTRFTYFGPPAAVPDTGSPLPR